MKAAFYEPNATIRLSKCLPVTPGADEVQMEAGGAVMKILVECEA